MVSSTDILILGAGMVGLSIAEQLSKRYSDLRITIVDKEPSPGRHSSGRNSGVLHAGIYYPPGSLKSKVCIKGARRLLEWCHQHEIPTLKCGKVIATQEQDLDPQLDLLLQRGIANGAEVRLIDEHEFLKKVPDGRTASGRALWSPSTSVVNPKLVIKKLSDSLDKKGIDFILGAQIERIDIDRKQIQFSFKNQSLTHKVIKYRHIFNCTGSQADRIAHSFGVGNSFTILPFKGIYWRLDPKAPFRVNTNLYPVPDLNVPFLGVHFTPSIDGTVYVGPTAFPAFGRENYKNIAGIEPLMSLQFAGYLTVQMLENKGGFRKYAREQALQGLKPIFLNAAQKLVPKLRDVHLLRSEKVGIRAQLFNINTGTLVQDFVLENGNSSTHVLNAISPAFTASFELADLIIDSALL